MRKTFKKAVIMGGLIIMPLSATFAQSAQPYGDKFLKDPYAKVTKADQKYIDVKGNEFQVWVKTSRMEEGKWITVDPDDMIPVNDQNGRVVLSPRKRFLDNLNADLPQIPGFEMPRPNEKDGLSPYGTEPMLKHITDPVDKGGHGLQIQWVFEQFLKCHEPRDIPDPRNG